MTAPLTRRLLWPLAASVAALVACANLVIGWRIALPTGSATQDRLGDLHVYTGALEHLARTGSLYTYESELGLGYTYPPISATLFAPLTWARAETIDALWTLMMLLALLVCSALVTHRVTSASTSRPIRYAVLAGCTVVLLQSAQVQSGLVSGNVSVLLTTLCLLDVGGTIPQRWRGALVGIASAVKLTPLIFVPHYLLTRQRGALVRSVGVLALLTVLGWLVHPHDSVDYWTDKIFETDRIGDLAFLGNQSASGALARIGVEGTAGTAGWLLFGTVVGVVGLWGARQAHLAGDPLGSAIVLGCASVVASPVSWPFHQIWLPLAGLLLLARGLGALRKRRSRGSLWWLPLGAILIVSSIAWPLVFDVLTTVPGGSPLAENWQFLSAVAVVATGVGQDRRSERRTEAMAGQATSGTNFFHGWGSRPSTIGR